MSEFALCVFCLFLFVVLPLINLCVLPVRYGLAKSMVDAQVHRLAHCELLSDALKDQAHGLDLALGGIEGVKVKNATTVLEVEAAKMPTEIKTVIKAGTLSAQWLPEGSLGPYIYRLRVRADLKIAPVVLVKLGGLNVPGLTVPLPVTLDEQCLFENLGRDPNTGEYFVNE